MEPSSECLKVRYTSFNRLFSLKMLTLLHFVYSGSGRAAVEKKKKNVLFFSFSVHYRFVIVLS